MNINPHATLDPPGTIVVLGTTPIGIEAALYGRFLGYDVKLIAGVDHWRPRDFADPEFQRIGPTFQNDWFDRHWLQQNGFGSNELKDRYDDAIPMMPDRCLSSLASSALDAQRNDMLRPLPETMRQWIEGGLAAVTQTDLLRGRVFTNTFVDSIELVPVSVDEPDDDDEGDETSGNDDNEEREIPPDFRLHLSGEPIGPGPSMCLDCECVIVADLPVELIARSFALPADYLFIIGGSVGGELVGGESSGVVTEAAEMLLAGYRQISTVFSQLSDRPELDLYRPLRL